MSKRTQGYFEAFFLILTPAMLVLALILDRWYACFQLVLFWAWLIARSLPSRKPPQPLP